MYMELVRLLWWEDSSQAWDSFWLPRQHLFYIFTWPWDSFQVDAFVNSVLNFYQCQDPDSCFYSVFISVRFRLGADLHPYRCVSDAVLHLAEISSHGPGLHRCRTCLLCVLSTFSVSSRSLCLAWGLACTWGPQLQHDCLWSSHSASRETKGCGEGMCFDIYSIQ